MRTTTIDMIGESGWLAYCKTIALGSRLPSTQAKLCLNIGEPTPSRAMRKLERQLTEGKIDGESYRVRTEAVEALEEMFRAGIQTHRVATPGNDWQELGGGGHMRRTHHSGQNG